MFVELDIRHPVPETAVVHWTVEDASEFEKELAVRSVVGADFNRPRGSGFRLHIIRIFSTLDPLGHETTRAYDAAGRVVREIFAYYGVFFVWPACTALGLVTGIVVVRYRLLQRAFAAFMAE